MNSRGELGNGDEAGGEVGVWVGVGGHGQWHGHEWKSPYNNTVTPLVDMIAFSLQGST